MTNLNIPKRSITDILSLGFLTGSRVLGGWKEESDWDIVVSILNKQEAIGIIEPHSVSTEPSEYFAGITYYITDNKGFNYFNHKINLIFVHPNEYAAWYYATVALSGILKDADIKDKTSRVLLFETLKVQLRDKLPTMYAKRRDEMNEKLTMTGALRWAAPFLETFLPGANVDYDNPIVQENPF